MSDQKITELANQDSIRDAIVADIKSGINEMSSIANKIKAAADTIKQQQKLSNEDNRDNR